MFLGGLFFSEGIWRGVVDLGERGDSGERLGERLGIEKGNCGREGIYVRRIKKKGIALVMVSPDSNRLVTKTPGLYVVL